jgi:sarcosine oxidase subunit beta
MRVAIVGAGAVGSTAARHLATEGHCVEVYDREGVAGGATGRAAGLAYAAETDPVDASLAQSSLKYFRALDGEGSFEFSPCPYVWFARDSGETADAIRRGVERMRDLELAVERLDRSTLRAEFSELTVSDIEVAAVAHDAGYADPAAYARLEAQRAVEAGATLNEQTAVRVRTGPPRVVRDGTEEFDVVAIAAGAHTTRICDDAGHPIAMKPYRVQALTTDGSAGALPMMYDATAGIYARPHTDGILVGDGTEETEADPMTWRTRADDEFVGEATDYLAEHVSGPGHVERAWAGLCTATPDGDPLLGALSPGLYVATGWQGHGFMRAPETGRLLAKAVIDGETPEPKFDPQRFDGDEEFPIVEGMRLE